MQLKGVGLRRGGGGLEIHPVARDERGVPGKLAAIHHEPGPAGVRVTAGVQLDAAAGAFGGVAGDLAIPELNGAVIIVPLTVIHQADAAAAGCGNILEDLAVIDKEYALPLVDAAAVIGGVVADLHLIDTQAVAVTPAVGEDAAAVCVGFVEGDETAIEDEGVLREIPCEDAAAAVLII